MTALNVADLIATLEAIRDYPANGNSNPDVMETALDWSQAAAARALLGESFEPAPHPRQSTADHVAQWGESAAYRYDLIAHGPVDDRYTVAAMADASAFVTDLYKDGHENENDPQDWPFVDRDTVSCGVADEDAVIVGYGPGPDGNLTFGAYVIMVGTD